MSNDFGLTKDDKFVDTHGRDISTTTIGARGEVGCLLSDLKQTGVSIYRKGQYAKLDTVNKDFGPNFLDYMLEAAKSYMLANKISFTEEQIASSIESCKQILSGNKNVVSDKEKEEFLKDREIESGPDHAIQIKVSTVTPRQSQTPPKQNLALLKNMALRSPRQPPIGRENDSGSDGTSSRGQHLSKKFPQKGAPVENLSPKNLEKEEFKKSNGNSSKELHQGTKRFVYNINAEEHKVMVTAIDKPNCIWVRDLANGEVFEEIYRKVSAEAKNQKIAARPWLMDKVYLAEDDHVWFRVKMVKYSPLTVLFLDYGNIAEVDELRDISEELAKVPCMAVRITFKAAHYCPRLEDEIRIKTIIKNDDGTYFVNILTDSTNPTTPLVPTSVKTSPQAPKENPTLKEENSEDSDSWEDSLAPVKKSPPEPEFFKKPQIVCSLLNDQRVAIAAEKDDVFYLRTLMCFQKLKEIERTIQEYVQTAKNLQEVKNDQLVLYTNSDRVTCRAIVTKINKNNVDIELLDYPETVSVNLASLKTISERLSKEPITYFVGGKLLWFENETLGQSCKEIIRKSVRDRKKYTVVLGFDDELDLFDGAQLLSEQLKKLENAPKKIFLKDMKTVTPEKGIQPYVCGYYKSNNDFAIASSGILQQHMDHVVRSEIEDEAAYEPVREEVCLCYLTENWYRCVTTKILDKEYEVLLLDFGYSEFVKKENLRKADRQVTEIPALALPCVLVDLPRHKRVEDMLKNMIIEGEIYNVDIKGINRGKWEVEIPSVYKKIREAL